MTNILDLREKLIDKIIQDCILNFEELTPEDQMILLEEYYLRFKDEIDIEEVKCSHC